MPVKQNQYRIVIRSHLGSTRIIALPIVDYMTTFDERSAPITTMTLQVTDQAELIGLLNELHGGGMELVALNHLNQESA